MSPSRISNFEPRARRIDGQRERPAIARLALDQAELAELAQHAHHGRQLGVEQARHFELAALVRHAALVARLGDGDEQALVLFVLRIGHLDIKPTL